MHRQSATTATNRGEMTVNPQENTPTLRSAGVIEFKKKMKTAQTIRSWRIAYHYVCR